MINRFIGKYRWLSNFWPCQVVYNGIRFATVEHAYQAAKTEDREEQLKISKLYQPKDAKKAGYAVKLRPDWEKVKINIMQDLVAQKFQHPELKKDLLDTGDEELIEGNNWNDTFWGVCKGKGTNHLGKILMDVRSQLKQEIKPPHKMS